jgi:hypothetical protein
VVAAVVVGAAVVVVAAAVVGLGAAVVVAAVVAGAVVAVGSPQAANRAVNNTTNITRPNIRTDFIGFFLVNIKISFLNFVMYSQTL